MAYLTLQKGSSANLNNVAVKDGQILVTTDTKKIYLDHGSNRLLLNDYPVKSVNGKTGTVSLSYSDVGAPSTTGTNASGTWGINVTGNATSANYLNVIAQNEIRFNNFNYNTLWFNHVQPDGTTNSTACTAYYFGDGQKQYSTVTLYAGQFSGNAATATKWATARTISLSGDLSGSVSIDGSANVTLTASVYDDSHAHTWLNSPGNHAEAASGTTASAPSEGLLYARGLYMTQNYGDSTTPCNYGNILNIAGSGTGQLFCEWKGTDSTSGGLWYRSHRDTSTGGWGAWRQVWCSGDSVTGAVWNDYAEYRESNCQEFGRVLVENGDDTLSISTERLQPFAGVSSDTWGFCQGETEKAKTPIAVAGRVLVYPYRDRNEYKPGDVVCAAPNGTVDIMTPQEEMMYPSRIVGTVSCVPDYEEWGNGDREPAKVNGRIWIKVK